MEPDLPRLEIRFVQTSDPTGDYFSAHMRIGSTTVIAGAWMRSETAALRMLGHEFVKDPTLFHCLVDRT